MVSTEGVKNPPREASRMNIRVLRDVYQLPDGVMSLRLLQKAGNFLSRWATVIFLIRKLKVVQ